MTQSLKMRIAEVLREIGRPAYVKEIAEYIADKPKSTVRGRIYDGLGDMFMRVARGVYWFSPEEEGAGGALLIEGNGRDLSMWEDESIDAIITDHPWDDPKSNRGGDRHFTDTYSTFRYELADFKEKARVLKAGSFLVEVLPAENENNYKYLHQIKLMAESCGLYYYAKVPWKKGTFISNTGRKSKNTEDIMFFTKGKPRALRPDPQRTKRTGSVHLMSGTRRMLPTCFDFQPAHVKKRIHQAEKPVELYEAIIDQITRPGEILLDQYAGSGNLGWAAARTNRFAILYEIIADNVQKIADRLATPPLLSQQLSFGQV